MEQDREKIEKLVKKCAARIDGITEERAKSIIELLTKMPDMKTVVDLLALNMEKLLSKKEQKADLEASMQDILELSEGVYSSVNEMMAQVQKNKAQNYTPRKYISRR